MNSLSRARMLFLIVFALPLQAAETRNAKVDAIFAAWNRLDSPGAAVGVIHKGNVIYARGYGSANLDHQIPITPKSVFFIASTSKQFTAAAIALLVLDGTISLDDDVRKYIPEIPEYEAPITVRHLVHHTSGLRDYIDLMFLAGRSFSDFFDNQYAINLLARQKSLNHSPGKDFVYSNSGYILMAEIVKRATGTDLGHFARQRIFDPLEMRSTRYDLDLQAIVPHRVTGYMSVNGGYRRFIKNFTSHGDGGVLSTVEDLARWDRNFYKPKVGGSAFLDLMHSKGRVSGREHRYAFGLLHMTHRGLRTVEHGGLFVGFRSHIVRYPDQSFTVIILCNDESMNVGRLARSVAEVYLEDDFGDPAAVEVSETSNPGEYEVDVSKLKPLTGVYRQKNGEQYFEVTVVDRKLRLVKLGSIWVFDTTPVSETKFHDTGIDGILLTFEFLRTDAGEVTGFNLKSEHETREFIRTADVNLNETERTAYSGSFYSQELDATFELTVEKDGLIIQRPSVSAVHLKSATDVLFVGNGWTLILDRSVEGRVAGFTLSEGRIRGLRFDRVPN